MAAHNSTIKEPGIQFRIALLKICNQLEVKDVDAMKFLIVGLPKKPGTAELEKVDTPMAFFLILVQYDLINEDDTSFLENLLENIGQIKLISELRNAMKSVSDAKLSSSGSDRASLSSHDSPQSTPASSLEYAPNTYTSSTAPDSGISSSQPLGHTVTSQSAGAVQYHPPPPAVNRQLQPTGAVHQLPHTDQQLPAAVQYHQLQSTGAVQKPPHTDQQLPAAIHNQRQLPVAVLHQPQPIGAVHQLPPDADQQLAAAVHHQPPAHIQGCPPTNTEPSTNSNPKEGYQSHHSPTAASAQVNPQNYQDHSVRPKMPPTSNYEIPMGSASPRERFRVAAGYGLKGGIDNVNVASAIPSGSFDGRSADSTALVSSSRSSEQHALQVPENLCGMGKVPNTSCERVNVPQLQHQPQMIEQAHNPNNHHPRFPLEVQKESYNCNPPYPLPTSHQRQAQAALPLQQMPLVQDNVVQGRPSHKAPPNLTHSTSCPEQPPPTAMSAYQIPDAHSHVSSFGIRPLISSDVHEMHRNKLIDLNRSMSAPDSSDFGPTIQSPSVSLEDERNSPMPTGQQSSSSATQSTGVSNHPDRGLNEQMRRLGLQNQESPHDSFPLSDLETDAPDENRAHSMRSTYLEECSTKSYLKSTSPISRPSSALSRQSCPKSDTTSKVHHVQFPQSEEVPPGASFGMATKTQEEQDDRMERIKSRVQRSLAKQRSLKNQDLVEPAVDDKPGKKTKLRGYQEELAAPAKHGGNFIICAPTGCGKTLTAAAVCRHHYDNAKYKGVEFKALFIVNMRHLTEQQTIAFRETFPEGTVATVGDTDMLSKVFYVPSHAVVMVTAQILLNTLKQKEGDVNLRDISMIIFDECHHTTQDHPYNEIMKLYLKMKRQKLGPDGVVGESGKYLPQILGLSASLGVGHGNNAYRHILTLCGNLDAGNVIQVVQNQDELEEFVNSPDLDKILYVRSRHKRELCVIVEKIMTEVENEVWLNGVPERHGTSTYEQWVAETKKEAEASRERVHLVACLYLFEFNRALMLYDELRAVDAVRYLEAFMEKRDIKQNPVPIEELCREYFHDNLERMKAICRMEEDADNPMLDALGKLLRTKFEEKPHSKGIILARTRLNTEALTDFINETLHLKYLRQLVKPTRLVGQGKETETERYMTEHEQKVSLQRFREDPSCNLLVATDIAQEGLDMPACNFVIRYNFVSNEIGTVQSKGRARAEQSECFLIVQENSKTAERELQNRQNVKDMQAAMDRLNALSEEKRIAEITTRQDEIYREMVRNEEKAKARKGLYNPEDVKLFCKECNKYITKASYIKTKGCHYTCVDPEIKQRIKIVENRGRVFRTTINTGVFKCVEDDCGQQLGTAIDFLDKEGEEVAYHGYGFKITSFLFTLPDGPSKTYKKWKLVPVDFLEHQE